MARLITCGFEVQSLGTTQPTTGEAETARVGGTPLYNTTDPYSGAACLECNSATDQMLWEVAGVLGRTYYLRCYFRRANALAPTSEIPVLSLQTAADVNAARVLLQTNGTLRARDNAGALLTGSFTPTVGVWYCVELTLTVPAAGAGAIEYRVNGEVIASSAAANTGNVAIGRMRAGGSATGGAVILIDDVILNDDQGAAPFNTRPGESKIVLLRPVADSAVGVGWEQPQTMGSDATDLHAALAPPPDGVAHADLDANNLRYIFDAALVGGSYDAAVQSYDEAGIPSGATIRLVQGLARVGTSDIAGTNTGTARLVSNPADAGDTAIDFEGATAVAGVDPAGWRTYRTPQKLEPAVVRATRPVMRVTRTQAGITRAHMVSLMGVYVEYEPSALVDLGGELGGGAAMPGGLDQLSPIVAALTGGGALGGGLQALTLLGGSLDGGGVMGGELGGVVVIGGELSGGGAIAGAFVEVAPLTGQLVGGGGLDGDMRVLAFVELGGDLAGGGVVDGDLNRIRALVGELGGGGSLVGVAGLVRVLEGVLAGGGSASGALASTAVLRGVLAGGGELDGRLTALGLLGGELAGGGVLGGNISAAPILVLGPTPEAPAPTRSTVRTGRSGSLGS